MNEINWRKIIWILKNKGDDKINQNYRVKIFYITIQDEELIERSNGIFEITEENRKTGKDSKDSF